ncbi:MAG: hypothetical protein HEQ35_20360 [Gloeotrichia echinulata IR180]|jgi:hypothetical protein
MARAIERIEKDIADLEEAIRAIASELQNADTIYLSSLGQSVRKQLILASYHLCTQGYPENFLSLSLNHRQQLQQAIRKLGQQAAENLLTSLSSQEDEEEEDEDEDEEDEDEEDEDEDEDDSNFSFLSPPPRLYPSSYPDLSNPIELGRWQQKMEAVIQDTLKKLSHETNVVLQKARILPKKLPERILEVAAAASEASAEVMPGPPNLLNLVIEIENDQDPDESSLTQITAINLRLGEIEFADPAVSSARKQIRSLLVQLSKLGREYEKKHRELSTAEAEAAWRASWFEN